MKGMYEEAIAEAAQETRKLEVDAKRVATDLTELAKTIDVTACRKARADVFKHRGTTMQPHEQHPDVCMSKASVSAPLGWRGNWPYALYVERHMDTVRYAVVLDGWADTERECGPVYKVALRFPIQEDQNEK